MKKSLICIRVLMLLAATVLFAAVCQGASKLPENKPLQDLTKVVIEDTKDTYYLGPIGARGWIQKISTIATLVKYGANAKRVLPQLKEMRNGKSPLGRLGASVDGFIKAIEESTEMRKLISTEEVVKIGSEKSKK
jgi:hypothetical protein